MSELDSDGYPTDEALERIKEWGHDEKVGDHFALMAFIKTFWWYPDWGWAEDDYKDEVYGNVRRFRISTGGWSGNESIIGAMHENFVFWSMCWHSSRRGGHWEFRLKQRKGENDGQE